MQACDSSRERYQQRRWLSNRKGALAVGGYLQCVRGAASSRGCWDAKHPLTTGFRASIQKARVQKFLACIMLSYTHIPRPRGCRALPAATRAEIACASQVLSQHVKHLPRHVLLSTRTSSIIHTVCDALSHLLKLAMPSPLSPALLNPICSYVAAALPGGHQHSACRSAARSDDPQQRGTSRRPARH